MPRPRMKIKTIREILRLDSMNFSTREIGRSVGKGSSSVNDIVRRARGADLEWSAAKEIDDQRLEEMLYSNSGVVREGNAEPDFPYVQRELQKKGCDETASVGGVQKQGYRQSSLQLSAVLQALQ